MVKFIEFKDYRRTVCIRVDAITGWSDDGRWVKVYYGDEGCYWDLTAEGSENFRKIWKELDRTFKG